MKTKGSRFTPKKADLPPKPEPIKPFYLGRMVREHVGREWKPEISTDGHKMPVIIP